ncbi:lipid IV(A) 3-deoxy-D-manno-octulosonic acid transferase [Haliea sp. AH-315-K21]|nr:lipid IV(A) 3-deoxy-D-manno-octulosonic acid transferase [Haliea sp. AH-315-K21]
MNRSIYTLIYYLALPLIFFRMWWRSLKDSRYRQRWLERLAFYPADSFDNNKPAIVFHAVSVGEVHAAVPLIRACQLALPEWTFTLTTTTVTGSARVKEIFGDSVQHCYMPYDSPGAVKRFLRAIKPEILVIMETELWPNLLFYSKQRSCKLLLLNARLSKKSFLNYQKYASLTAKMLLSFDAVAAQFEQDALHFRQLGLPEKTLHTSGTMKFDQEIDQQQLDAGLAMKQELQRPILVAGSTREGEEEKVLAAFDILLKVLPELLLILVPRHPDRFTDVAKLLISRGYHIVRRSRGEKVSSDKQILLGDSLGEMQFYYASADLAFVGGSLVDTGCQNIIEPAVLGVPVLTGPSLFNFQAVSELLLESGAMQVVANEKELAEKLRLLFQDKALRQSMAEAASATVAKNRGATEKQKQLILQAIHSDQ